jgi:hypothetical protein
LAVATSRFRYLCFFLSPVAKMPVSSRCGAASIYYILHEASWYAVRPLIFWLPGASRALLQFGYERRLRRDKTMPAKENSMSDDDMKAELERLRRENEALKKGASKGISMKVRDKGGLSVYGMGRFPVTLYKEQWLKLLNMSDEIRAFIAENEARLKAKD